MTWVGSSWTVGFYPETRLVFDGRLKIMGCFFTRHVTLWEISLNMVRLLAFPAGDLLLLGVAFWLIRDIPRLWVWMILLFETLLCTYIALIHPQMGAFHKAFHSPEGFQVAAFWSSVSSWVPCTTLCCFLLAIWYDSSSKVALRASQRLLGQLCLIFRHISLSGKVSTNLSLNSSSTMVMAAPG